MNDFFESKFVQDLKNGKLPEIEVTLADESLIKLFSGILVTAVLIIGISKIIRGL
jgi:hypothetical protein